MASSDVDQKYLGRLAEILAAENVLVSRSLYQVLGLSVLLSRKLFRARKLRKLDTSRDTKSLQLYHHIIWLSREGLSLLEVCVLPYTINGALGPECQVLTAKLRASFCHIFCLFNNNPPVTQVTTARSSANVATPLSPKDGNGQRRDRGSNGSSPPKESPRSSKRYSKGKQPTLRDPIASITSDASFLTNPYAGLPPGTSPPPPARAASPPGLSSIPVPHPSAFLLPAFNFIPVTKAHFDTASSLAAENLPGAHPLRLSVAIEQSAFLWDCVHDHEASRQLARRAIRELRHAEEEGVTDEMFEDAAEMVGVLGRIMRRRSWESSPPKSESKSNGEPQTPTAAPSKPASVNPALLFSSPPTPAPSIPLPAPPITSTAPSGSRPSTPKKARSHTQNGSIDSAPLSPTANTSASRRGSKATGASTSTHRRQSTRSSGGAGSLRTPKQEGSGRPVSRGKEGGPRTVEASPPPPPPLPKDSPARPRNAPFTTTPMTGRSRANTAASSNVASNKVTTPHSASKHGSSTAEKLEREREKERIRAAREHAERQRYASDSSTTTRTPPRASRTSSAQQQQYQQQASTYRPRADSVTSQPPPSFTATAAGKPIPSPSYRGSDYASQHSYPNYPVRTPEGYRDRDHHQQQQQQQQFSSSSSTPRRYQHQHQHHNPAHDSGYADEEHDLNAYPFAPSLADERSLHSDLDRGYDSDGIVASSRRSSPRPPPALTTAALKVAGAGKPRVGGRGGKKKGDAHPLSTSASATAAAAAAKEEEEEPQ